MFPFSQRDRCILHRRPLRLAWRPTGRKPQIESAAVSSRGRREQPRRHAGSPPPPRWAAGPLRLPDPQCWVVDESLTLDGRAPRTATMASHERRLAGEPQQPFEPANSSALTASRLRAPSATQQGRTRRRVAVLGWEDKPLPRPQRNSLMLYVIQRDGSARRHSFARSEVQHCIFTGEIGEQLPVTGAQLGRSQRAQVPEQRIADNASEP